MNLLCLLGIIVCAGASSPGYLKLNAQKSTQPGMSNAVRLLKQADQDGARLDLTNGQIFYQAVLEVGSDRQQVAVLVDTGSSDLWLLGADNHQCIPGETGAFVANPAGSTGPLAITDTEGAPDSAVYGTSTFSVQPNATLTETLSTFSWTDTAWPTPVMNCSRYGTFNRALSDTFVYNDTSDFEISYADNTYARGFWAHDTVRIGDIAVDNMSFAVANDTDNTMGILGIGPRSLETTNYGEYYEPYTYENFPVRLKQLGITCSEAYSIYLNSSESEVASILFGAVDHAKYTGSLSLFPLLNDTDTANLHPVFTHLKITLNRVTVGSGDDNFQVMLGEGFAEAIIDTGATMTYLPSPVLNGIVDVFGFEPYHYGSAGGAYAVRCANIAHSFVTFNFQGVDIRISMSSFVIPIVTTRGQPTGNCALALSDGMDQTILGDNFLRAVYVAVDLTNHQLAMAPATVDSNTENIQLINASIPSATSAPEYSTYYLPGGTFQGVNSTQHAISSVSTGTLAPMNALNGPNITVNEGAAPYTLGVTKLCLALASIAVVLII